MLSVGSRPHRFSPSQNIRVKPTLVGNVHYRHTPVLGSKSKIAGGCGRRVVGMGSLPKHILVVDDDGDVRDVIVTMLQSSGYSVSEASGGSTMRSVVERDDVIDCVVLDALMPGEASASLILHLKDMGIPVVMISGSLESIEFAKDNGLQLLGKPFRLQELGDAVAKALASGTPGQRDA